MSRCTEAALDLNARIFEGWGNIIGTPLGSAVSFVLGVVLLGALTAGMQHLEYFKDLDDIWIEEGTRAEREKKFFDSTFGGLSRIGQYMITRKDGTNVISPESVFALNHATQELFINIGNNSVITKTFTNDDGDEVDIDFGMQDFCERPDLPPSFGPYLSSPLLPYNSLQSVGSWLLPRKIDSGMWFYMSRCMADKSLTALLASNSTNFDNGEMMQAQWWLDTDLAGLSLDANETVKRGLFATRLGYDAGFGITKAPCTRGLMADCWADGDFDFLDEFKTLNEYSYAFAAMSNLVLFPDSLFNNSRHFFTECVDEAKGQITQVVAGGVLAQNPLVPPQTALLIGSQTAAQIETSFKLIALRFLVGVGFWWRPSVEAERDDFVNNTFRSISNAASHTATECVTAGVFRKILKHQIMFEVAPNVIIPVHPYAVPDVQNLSPLTGGCCIAWPGTLVAEGIFLGKRELGGAFAHRISTSAHSSRSFLLANRLRTERFAPNGVTLDDTEIFDVQADLVQDWESYQIEYLLKRIDNAEGTGFADGEEFEDFQIHLLLEQSINDLLSDAANVSPALILIGYIIMILNSIGVFLVFTCSKEFFIYSRPFMSFLGMASVGFSTAASFGVLAWGGMKLSPLNSALVPFMSMGLGIDDMFVLLQEFIRAGHLQDNPRLRMAACVREAGPSVTVTLVANAVAFMIASIVRLPAIYIFSYQMAAAMVLNWFGLFTVWLPFLYLNALRSAQKKAFCCTTEKAEVEVLKSSQMFESWIDKYIGPVFTNVYFKIFAICAFLGCTAGLTYVGFTQTEYGLRLSDVALDGSYVRTITRIQEDHFGTYPVTLITREVDFTNSTGGRVDFSGFQSNIQAFLQDMTQNPFVDKSFPPAAGYFYKSLLGFYIATGHPGATEIPAGEEFYTALRGYLSGVGITDLVNLACRNVTSGEIITCQNVDGEEIVIAATRGSGYVNGILTDDDYTDAIRSVRRSADTSGGNFDNCCSSESNGTRFDPTTIFYGGSLFKFWEQYVNIKDTFYKTIGFCLLGVFLATLLFQFSPFSSFLVGVMLLATALQLYGFMSMIGVKLNGFSVTNLAIAVGMSVEFTAHMSYSFLRANRFYKSRDERMVQALKETLQPMLAGAISSLISVVCLAFAKYPFFRQYYFYMVALMTALAFVNGQVFLPIILSVIGPPGLVYDPAMATATADAKIVDDIPAPQQRSHSGKLADQQL